jgi:RHS repeat-associated protein
VSFGVGGMQTNTTYYWELYCDRTYVTNCSTPLGSMLTSPISSFPVDIWTGAAAGTGRVRVKLYKAGGTPSDSGWLNISVHELTPPTITLMQPASYSTTQQYPTIQIGWCDNTSLNSGSRSITVNGSNVTSSFDYNTANGPTGCGASASSTTTSVPLNLGSNTVQSYICDNWSNCTTSNSWTITRTDVTAPTITLVTPSPATVFTQYPQLQIQWCDNGSLNSATRQIKVNNVDLTSTFNYVSGGSACSVSATSTTTAVSLNTGANTIQAYVCDNANNCTTQNFTVNRAGVTLVNHNRDNMDRSYCLTVAAGEAAESSCGDLIVYHGMPSFKTMNTSRSVMLVYNSATAAPRPRVAALVTIAPGDAPQNVFAQLSINGGTRASATYSSSGWSGNARQVALAFDASDLSSGAYPFNLLVRLNYAGGTFRDTTLTDTLLLVNRQSGGGGCAQSNACDFGSGWFVSGVESLVLAQPGNSILWFGADGSAKLYRNVGTGQWLAPAGAFRDSIVQVGANYERHGQHGVTVVFDGSGRHSQTRNRLGFITNFNWTSGHLTSIVLPPASSTVQLTYDANAKLDYISDPIGRVLDATVSGGLLTQLKDPDNQIVSFAYDGARRLTARINPRLAFAHYFYDNALRLTKFSVELSSVTDTATTAIANWDEFGLAVGVVGATMTAANQADVRTTVDGPRIDVPDITTFYVNAFGAPTQIVDGEGHQTLIDRGDSRWPGLPTQVHTPDGLVTKVIYTTRGNLDTVRVINPMGSNPAQDAITHYHWNSKWDFADSIITPTGVITTLGYSDTTGNRNWQQLGTDAQRRVSFRYTNTLSLLSSTVLPQTTPDSVQYDGLGNVKATETPRGFWTSFYKDNAGRDTLVVTPIDSTDKGQGGAQDSTARARQRVLYTVMGREWINESIAPNRAEDIYVTKLYDAEGNLTSLARNSTPDPTSIGTVTTQWRYDLANRRVAEIAPDGAKDSTAYDSVGNVVAKVTRRLDPTSGLHLTITMSYDTLNRLTTRNLPAVNYTSRPTQFTITKAHGSAWDIGAYAAYAIPAETHTFTYDLMGRLLTANNADAKIKRSYYPGGLLQTDSLWIQMVDHSSWTKHVYGLTHYYDLDGRDTLLSVPQQLGINAYTTSIKHSYDSLGTLRTLHDLQANQYNFYYDLRGELDSIAYPGSYGEWMRYDADGRLTGDTIQNFGSGSWPRPPSPYVRATTYRYDARGKLLLSGDVVRFRDSVQATYTGLGNLQSTLWIQHGCPYCDLDSTWKAANLEVHSQDALGNKTLTSIVSQQILEGTSSFSLPPNSYDTLGYLAGVGRLTSSHTPGSKKRTYYYDQGGNTEFESAIAPADSAGSSAERASFFAADGSLRMVDSRWAENAQPYSTQQQQYVVEDYRYDPLGRRIWMRSMRLCGDYHLTYRASTECKVGFVRRTIWDGDQEVAEIQAPWTIEGYVSYDTTYYRALADSDVTATNFLQIATNDGTGGDPNKLFGYVVYGGFRGVDQPMAITRVNYAWIQDWYSPSVNVQSPAQVQAPFTIIPFWDMKGDAPQGVIATGERTLCNPSTTFSKCVAFQWPWDWSSTDRQRNLPRAVWHGSMLEGKRDKSGLGYSRNRYYDPNTGRFTQEDPIGLAGGANLYGFANGDPLNGRDPFGLMDVVFGDSITERRVREGAAKDPLVAKTLEELENDHSVLVMIQGLNGNEITGPGIGLPLPGHNEKGQRAYILAIDLDPAKISQANAAVRSLGGLDAGDIVAHELYGHIRPWQLGTACLDRPAGLNSCAILRENEIRAERGRSPRQFVRFAWGSQ